MISEGASGDALTHPSVHTRITVSPPIENKHKEEGEVDVAEDPEQLMWLDVANNSFVTRRTMRRP